MGLLFCWLTNQLSVVQGFDMIIECADPEKIAFSYKEIDNPVLLKYAKDKLPLQGILKQNDTGSYCYLKVHDDFIFELFPLIKEAGFSTPEYFMPTCDIGAHISTIYPEEMFSEKMSIDELEQSFSFEINNLVGVTVFNKTFFALTVTSPSLEQFRLKYGFPTKLNFRGLIVPFHITVAIKE